MTRITIAQAQSSLSEALDQVTRRGERVVLTRRGRKVAFLLSVKDMMRLAKLENRSVKEQSARPERLSPSALMKRPRKERERVLAESASRASQVYADKPELTDFEAFGDEDLAE